MTVGSQLLRALVESRSRSAIRSLSADLFDENERPAYDFIERYYRRYGELPTLDAVRENGFTLLMAPDSVDYYVERTRSRAIGKILQEEHPAFVQAMRTADVEAAGQALEAMLRGYRRFRNQNDTLHARAAIEQVIADFQEARLSPGIRGVTTGWEYLDGITGGIANGDIWALVARPGLGKSYTMIKMALAAWLSGYSVLFISMEMTILQTARRLVGIELGVDPDQIRRGLADMFVERMMHEVLQASESRPPLYLVSGDLNKSVRDVDAMIQEYTPDVVFVDAAYLLDAENKSGRYSKHEALQDVLKGLKSTALMRDRGIVISVQFNRDKGKSQGSLDTIAGTDWIGQVASVVMGMNVGLSPEETVKRLYSVLKNRDSRGDQKFETNFLFRPFNMDFLHELNPDGTPQTSSNLALIRGML